ncbi:sphingomyelin synthase-related protein 1 isoform 2-T6 [Trichechus inunguis]|uniref:Sphingomyelin synthase-related protein 1 n=1 Tax=Trichechus manatus latirostris TaxID=127582 RepID=A0A2Y9RPF3_TRIMA|nr:sphingomyelin synthase-related protein 1 isoform X1 [Trichechus manatus latirostris]XP_023593429.1 sphingomyelin synthase-related protein 1 isoform X1 [Trichechus manatus latirostris]XP_023593430.1 sphingomyelin synthase-related protein 1 isoform X1 [Trichechus manatus latirostris]
MAGPNQLCIRRWTTKHVAVWLKDEGFFEYVDILCNKHRLDGITLLTLTEYDLRSPPLEIKVLGDIKRLMLSVRKLQKVHIDVLEEMDYNSDSPMGSMTPFISALQGSEWLCNGDPSHDCDGPITDLNSDQFQYMNGKNKHSVRRLDPEYWKTILSCIYVFIVFGFTSFIMVIVHERVPDMQTYPPLPDIFLDSVPRIPWAFAMTEVCGMILCYIWLLVLLLHKHRDRSEMMMKSHEPAIDSLDLSFFRNKQEMSFSVVETPPRTVFDQMSILLRRLCSLMGTVFLLRCFTMFVTSLSVPGQHLQCTGKVYGSVWEKLHRAFAIWSGFGMTLTGVHTCGDYMFSGHTVVLTMLNFFVTEYTPRSWNFLHTLSWVLNLFGIFFILAAHEHYSIDVFIAFYITTRLFLYYHTLANTRAYQQSRRARIWFPMFSFFECNVNGTVPNEYCWPFSKPAVMKRLIG